MKALVQPNLKFGCCELGISNSHLPLRANFKFTRTRGDGFQVAGVTLGKVMGRRAKLGNGVTSYNSVTAHKREWLVGTLVGCVVR